MKTTPQTRFVVVQGRKTQLTVGGQSLTPALDGQFNFTTRQTVLNGVVVDGWWSGAQIHEEGKVVAFSPLTFVGTVMVMRGSAN